MIKYALYDSKNRRYTFFNISGVQLEKHRLRMIELWDPKKLGPNNSSISVYKKNYDEARRSIVVKFDCTRID